MALPDRFGSERVRGFRQIGIVAGVACLIILGMQLSQAQSRGGGSSSQRSGPELPSTGYQNEAVDLSEGKTPSQIFASDCTVCHQKPNNLAAGRNAGELANFLRQHYTTGAAQARILAAYVASLSSGGGGQAERGAPARQEQARPEAPAQRGLFGQFPDILGVGRQRQAEPESGDTGRRRKPVPERTESPAAAESKPSETDAKPAEKPAEAKLSDDKPDEAKSSEAKPSEAKPSETKPETAKPETTKPAEEKPASRAHARPGQTKPAEAKPRKPEAAASANKPGGAPQAAPDKPAAPAAPAGPDIRI